MADIQPVETKTNERSATEHRETIEHVKEVNAALTRTDSYLDETPVDLGWRSWLVVLVTMFA